MRDSYDAVVVGSGFGGAVAACRLAQAGMAVGILERGRRYAKGGFPRDWHDPLNGWVWQRGQGLFDVRPVNEVTVVQGAAYGGGSHLYANVHLRVPPDGFRTGWPAGYSRTALDPYYDLAAYMLDITPISADQPLGLPPKTRLMREVAERLGRSEQFCYPNLAVSFAAPYKEHRNKFGVAQEGCRHCGECDIGCNYRAKNTLDLNYLAVAEQRGADVGTQCEVLRLDRVGDTYEVLYRDHVAGEDRRVRAPAVFLCAGTVNTTELLLRCRDQYRSLPGLSNRLGHGYSANGDFLAFAMDTDEPFEPSVGPTITTGIVYDRGAGDNRTWFIFQEGGFPREIAGLVRALNHRARQGMEPARIWDEVASEIRELAGKTIDSAGGVGADSAVFLVMGRDRADGRIELMPVTHDLRVTWDVPANLPLYDTEERFCADVAAELGGQLTLNPLWQHLRLPVSVHNLGGAVMADDPTDGVVGGDGEVYGYPGLYVLDGAALPAATGVNPSHTIAAVAERNIETAIRKMTSDSTWRAPERALAGPVVDPVSALVIPAGGTAQPSHPPVGLRFTETMRGYVTRGMRPWDDYHGGEAAGRRAGAAARFTLTITASCLDDFLASPEHPAMAVGTVYAAGFTGTAGAAVSNGVFNLFSPGDGPDARLMLYSLPFFGADGRPYTLDGFKDVRDHGRFDVWPATSTLYTVIRAGHHLDGDVLATGILHILLPDFMRQLTTFRVTGTKNPMRQAETFARFDRMFAGNLWDVFVRPRIR